jgi:hypothetical protein
VLPIRAEFRVTFEQLGRYYQADRSYTSLERSGDFLFAGTEADGWEVIDVSNPQLPTGVFANSVDRNVQGLRVQDAELFVDLLDTFTVYDISSPALPLLYGKSARNPTLLGIPIRFVGLDAPDSQYGVGGYAYSVDTKTYYRIPASVFRVPPGILCLAADIPNNLLVGGSYNGLYLMRRDISANQQFIGAISANPVYSLSLTTNMAVAASGDIGVQFFSLTNPAAPTLLKTINL